MGIIFLIISDTIRTPYMPQMIIDYSRQTAEDIANSVSTFELGALLIGLSIIPGMILFFKENKY